MSFLKINLFIYLFLAAMGLRCCVWAFSGCGERGLLFVAVNGLLIAVTSLVAEHRLQQLWLMGSRAQAQQLWLTGLVAPRHVGSSRTRARTCVPCTGRQILNHCTTREVPCLLSYFALCTLCLVPYVAHNIYGENIDPASYQLGEDNCVHRSKNNKKKINKKISASLGS